MKHSTEISRYNDKNNTETNTDVVVYFNYQPAEKQELNYPGCDEGIEIYSVRTHDARIFDVTIAEEATLESECLMAWHSQ